MELVYKSWLMSLQTDFQISDKIKLNWNCLLNPLICPEDCQMELIKRQADMNTKRKYSENSLVDFYKLYVCEKFPNLSCQAKKNGLSL